MADSLIKSGEYFIDEKAALPLKLEYKMLIKIFI
jgi:hypothetical protein